MGMTSVPIAYTAFYFDGLTAARQLVSISIDRGAVLITSEDGTYLAEWELRTVHLRGGSRRANRVSISAHKEDAARLQISERAFLDQLFQEAPHIGRVAFRKPSTRVAISLISAVAAASLFLYFGLTGFSDTMSRFIPRPLAVGLGESVLGQILVNREVCWTEEGQTAIDQLGQRLIVSSGLDPQSEIMVVDWDMKNAFAVPGHVVFMSGLIAEMESPEEFAGVLAHEMGHNIARHTLSRLVQIMGLDVLLAFVGVDGSTVLDLAAEFGGLLFLLKNSRDDEQEADELATEILEAAKINPQGLATLFARLLPEGASEDGDEEGGLESLISTHPRLADRIDAIPDDQTSDWWSALDQRSWQAIKAICNSAVSDARQKHMDIRPGR